MTIKRKIYTAGIIIVILFILLAAVKLRSYLNILDNIMIHDEGMQRLSALEKTVSWENALILYITESLTGLNVSGISDEILTVPEGSHSERDHFMGEYGRELILRLRQRDSFLQESFAEINNVYIEITVVCTGLQLEIAESGIRRKITYPPENTEGLVLNFPADLYNELNNICSAVLKESFNLDSTEESLLILERERKIFTAVLPAAEGHPGLSSEISELLAGIDKAYSLISGAAERYRQLDSAVSTASELFFSTVNETATLEKLEMTAADLSEANEILKRTGRQEIIIIIVFLFAIPTIVLLTGVYSLNRLIFHPIAQLMNAMRYVESGDYDIGNLTERDDEMGMMANAFSAMTKEIKIKIEEMSGINISLKDSETKYKTLIENLPQKIFLKDTNSVYISCNRNYALEMKISEENIRGMTDFDLYPAELAEKYTADDQDVMQHGHSREIEERYVSNGREFIVQTIKTPVQNKDGEVVGILGIFWDITKRKHDEIELKKARTYISNIINSMPSVLVSIDREGLVTQWNYMAARTTGISPEEASGKLLTDVFPRFTAEMEKIRESLVNREVKRERNRITKEGDEIIYEDVTVYPLIANGSEGAVIRIDDVTEKVRLEEMLIQSEKMLSVGGLAAGMAHEINNPLAGILQTANVMRKRLGEDLNIPASSKAADEAGTTIESIYRYMELRGIFRMLKTINESGKRVADIVNNMLSFARKSDEGRSTHNIAALIDKTIELTATDYDMKKDYDFNKIEVIREYDDPGLSIQCESGKIQQVLMNLFRNAAQAMLSAGTESPRLIIRTRTGEAPDMLHIEIEDNGPGMEEQVRKRIFEPFFTTKAVGIGTGLGLSVSYFIITENHNGSMQCESRPGQGTKFIMNLPREAADE